MNSAVCWSATAVRITLLLLPALTLTSCGGTAVPGGAPRQAAAPGIPDDPRLDKFVGEWTDEDGQVVLSIIRNADGSGCISSPQNPAWDEVINNVRFEGETLCYDSFNYYKGKESFRTISNTAGVHPYSGVRNEVVLSPADDARTLKQRVVTKDVPNGIEATLRRRSSGSAISPDGSGNSSLGNR